VIYLVCFGIGTFLAGVAAFWSGLRYTIEPSMGQRPVIFAFVVAFLAGTARSPLRVFLTGIVVGVLEQLASIWLSTRWTETTVFVLLVGYLTSLSLRGRKVSEMLRFLWPAPPRPTPAAANAASPNPAPTSSAAGG